ncbi:MAG TPA: GNAT family N-acetyltransferase [Caulobacteraceae bacterium]|jgi:GNAT superfamily N-acetyltransferase|nr:GNAT family N-acetyltransferase [Caulobacteraceae bacterium]
MTGTVTRKARPADLLCLAAIEDSGVETFAAYGQPLADGSPPAPPDQWARALDDGLLWVADDEEHGVIGFLAGELTGDALYIEEVDVLMQHQRRGHGRRLTEAAIVWARANGLGSVTLTTFRAIPWNAPFYASLGFSELAPAQLGAHLAAVLAAEAASGFEDRCAMRLAL